MVWPIVQAVCLFYYSVTAFYITKTCLCHYTDFSEVVKNENFQFILFFFFIYLFFFLLIFAQNIDCGTR